MFYCYITTCPWCVAATLLLDIDSACGRHTPSCVLPIDIMQIGSLLSCNVKSDAICFMWCCRAVSGNKWHCSKDMKVKSKGLPGVPQVSTPLLDRCNLSRASVALLCSLPPQLLGNSALSVMQAVTHRMLCCLILSCLMLCCAALRSAMQSDSHLI